MAKVFPCIPETTYAIIIEGKPRVRLWPVKEPITSLKKAREEGKKARAKLGLKVRILILAYDRREIRFSRFGTKRTWEVK